MNKIMKSGYFALLPAVVIVLVAILVFNLLGFEYSCVFKALTGIPCPTCGMTRSFLSLLKLDLKSAFYYHPLFWVVPIIAGSFLIKNERIRKYRKAFLVLTVTLFIAVYLLRLFLLSDSLIYLYGIK